MISGDKGVLSNAEKAKEKTDESSAKLEVGQEYRNVILKSIKNSSINVKNTLKTNLIKIDPDANVISNTTSDYNMDVLYKGYKFTIEDGEIVPKST